MDDFNLATPSIGLGAHHITVTMTDGLAAFGSVTFTPFKECRAWRYSAQKPCAGPHHICQGNQREEAHGSEMCPHKCFCGYSWRDNEPGAIEMPLEEFGRFYRAGYFGGPPGGTKR